MWAWIEIVVGLIFLVYSAERFIEGSANTARHLGMPPLLIGMFIVGFGTSAPELLVSSIAAAQNNGGLSLGNAIGSNITNIGLILGVTALIQPIQVHSKIVRQELPVLFAVTCLLGALLWDHHLSRLNAVALLGTFAFLATWSITHGLKTRTDDLANEFEDELKTHRLPLGKALLWMVLGLLVLIASSRVFVDGAISVAADLGVSEVVIGLTIVAFGTSLPEFAASVIAARKGEHDIAIGNVIGSNIFNALVVTGVAGSIQPIGVVSEVWGRDVVSMLGITLTLFVFSYGFRGHGQVNRIEGGLLFVAFIAYTSYLVAQATGYI